MNSWGSGRSWEEPDPASSRSEIQPSPAAGGTPAADWPVPGPLLDGSGPLHAFFTGPPPTVRLAGDIDEWTYPDLAGVLGGVATAPDRRIRIDLSDVEYCDVAGLRTIISLAGGDGDDPDTAGQLVLAHLPGSLRAVLRILGWDATPGLVLEDGAC